MCKTCREFTFACFKALDPRIIEFKFTSVSTIVEPRATKRATAELAGALDDAALRTHRSGRWRGSCEDWCVGINQTHQC